MAAFKKFVKLFATRDVSAILIVTFIALLATIVFIWSSNEQRLLGMRSIIDQNQLASKKMQLVNQLIETARARTRLTAGVIYVEDPFVQDEMALELDILASRFAKRRSEFLSLPLSDREAEILDHQAEIVPTILPAQRRAVELAMQGGEESLQEAEKLLHEVVNPGQTRLVNLFVELIDLQQANIEKLAIESQRSYASAQRENRILVTVAMLFGSLLSVVVVIRVRNIQRKIANARDRLEVAVTERTQELASSQSMLQTVLDTIPARVFWKDVDGAYLGCNRLFARDAGLGEPAEITGKADADLSWKANAPGYDKEDRNVISTGISVVDREEPGTRSGEQAWWEMTKVPLKNNAGDIVGMLGSYNDITERKRMERVKDEFVSTVSHELRTPLTSINGALGLLLGGALGKLPTQVAELLEVASRNTHRLLALINDILDIQKIEAGEMVYEFKTINLADIIEHAVEENSEYAKAHDVEYVMTEKNQALVKVDEHRIMQVMGNLLSNAAKFSPAGARVEVALTCKDDFAEVSVKDHGRGIPARFHATLFDRFTQVDSSDARQKGGTGLGLAISRSIIEKHDGSIGFDTEDGVGTTFYFSLPLAGQVFNA